MSLILIALGIWMLLYINSIKTKYPLYPGQIVDISQTSSSWGKFGSRHRLIIRVIINQQPIITSTSSFVNCFCGLNSALAAKKKTHVGRRVNVYFNHKIPQRSIVKEFENKYITVSIILFIVGAIMMFAEFMPLLALLYHIKTSM